MNQTGNKGNMSCEVTDAHSFVCASHRSTVFQSCYDIIILKEGNI